MHVRAMVVVVGIAVAGVSRRHGGVLVGAGTTFTTRRAQGVLMVLTRASLDFAAQEVADALQRATACDLVQFCSAHSILCTYKINQLEWLIRV